MLTAKAKIYTRSYMAATTVLSQIQVIPVRIAKGHVLSPVSHGLRQRNIDVDLAN